MQLSGGMVQTAMRNLDTWGLYITGFMFFVGLSAGGLIIRVGAQGPRHPQASAASPRWPCSRPSPARCVAIGLVVVDMGQPFRVWELFVYSNSGQPAHVGYHRSLYVP